MAWSSAAIPSDELGWYDDDKPCALGGTVISSASTLEWQAAGANDSDADYPETRGYDGYTDLLTQPATAGTTRDYVAEFTTGVTIDTFALLGHELVSDGATALRVYIADDAAFTVNAQLIYELLAFTTKRVVGLELMHTGSTPLRYSSVQYIMVRIVCASSKTPAIGEVLLGQRRQFKSNPTVPWDPSHLRTDKTTIRSLSGVQTTYVRNKGQRILRAQFRPYEDDRVSDFQTLWETDCDYGTLPFFWIDEPTSNPTDGALMVWDSLDREMPYVGVQERVYMIDASEQGPDFISQGV